MGTESKISVEGAKSPDQSQGSSGTEIEQTDRSAVVPVAEALIYARIRQLRGTVSFTRTIRSLKADR